MNARDLALILATLLLTAASSPALAAPAVVNGSFDESVPRNGTGGGWTSVDIDENGGWNSGLGAPAPCYRLNMYGSADLDPHIWQDVAGFVPGETYTIRGEYALMYAGGTPDASFEVRVDGVAVLALGPAPEHVAPGVFVAFSVDFTASAATQRIEFAAETNGSDHDYCIDDIAIDAAVPAATTAWGAVKALYESRL